LKTRLDLVRSVVELGRGERDRRAGPLVRVVREVGCSAGLRLDDDGEAKLDQFLDDLGRRRYTLLTA
jgi:hypothetical protein